MSVLIVPFYRYETLHVMFNTTTSRILNKKISLKLPCGEILPDEHRRTAAMRILFEQTGIVASVTDKFELIDFGEFEFQDKKVDLFFIELSKTHEHLMLTEKYFKVISVSMIMESVDNFNKMDVAAIVSVLANTSSILQESFDEEEN